MLSNLLFFTKNKIPIAKTKRSKYFEVHVTDYLQCSPFSLSLGRGIVYFRLSTIYDHFAYLFVEVLVLLITKSHFIFEHRYSYRQCLLTIIIEVTFYFKPALIYVCTGTPDTNLFQV